MVTPAAGQLGFIPGSNDQLRPLDAQTLGITYLLARGRYADALEVRAYIESAFKLSGRSIVKSATTATFNQTYAATGLLGISHTIEDRALATWRNVTIGRGEGPLQADRTVTDSTVNE
jgi:hypothetical protein